MPGICCCGTLIISLLRLSLRAKRGSLVLHTRRDCFASLAMTMGSCYQPSIDVCKFGCANGRAAREVRMPSGQARTSRAPIVSRKPEIEMCECAPDSDVANAERARRTVGFSFEPVEALCGLEPKPRQVLLGLRLAGTVHLSEAQHNDVHQAIAQGLAPQRLPAQIGVGGKQLRSIVQSIEILADYARVVEGRAVVEHQGRDLAERVVLHDLG